MPIDKLNPVAWTEGMFLRPQHLQQHDLFADARLHYHLRTLDPFHWGVRKLVIDPKALEGRQIVVTELEAVLRDGTLVQVPDNATIAPRSFEAGRDRIDVYLALRGWSETEPNLMSSAPGAAQARFRTQEVELPDLNRGGPKSGVEVLAPNLRLLLSGEEAEIGLHDSFKLLEIEATDDSNRAFAESRSYVPPLLSMQASPVLREDFARIVNQVVARVRVAAGQTKTLSLDSVPKLFMRYTLARAAPLLRHLESTGATSPFGLYTVLVDLAGALGWFRHEDAVTLPTYDHENLYPCFRGLFQFIATELDRLAPSGFEKLPMPFEPAVQAYATKGLNMQLVNPRNSFYLAIRAPIEAQALAEQVTHGKASSSKGVGAIVKFNVPGLPLERLPGAPTEIESMAGYLYFRVDSHSKEWVKVRDEFSFALHLGKLEDASVFLYVAVAERGA